MVPCRSRCRSIGVSACRRVDTSPNWSPFAMGSNFNQWLTSPAGACHYLPMRSFTLIRIGLLLGLLLLPSCKNTYYAAYEKVGVYKRDLLKKRVVAARDAQQDAQ